MLVSFVQNPNRSAGRFNGKIKAMPLWNCGRRSFLQEMPDSTEKRQGAARSQRPVIPLASLMARTIAPIAIRYEICYPYSQ